MRRLAPAALVLLLTACSDSSGAGGGGAADAADIDAADAQGDGDSAGDALDDADAPGDTASDIADTRVDGEGDRDADVDDTGADTTDARADLEPVGCVDDPLLGPGLWPPQATLEDASTLDLEVLDEWTTVVDLVPVAVTALEYTSWQVVECELQPVRIEAFYAIPASLQGAQRDPAIVVAHGLGGCSDADGAARRAARFGVAALYYTAPGNCNSTGRGNSDPTALFATIPDPRGSWFWSHAVAGSRAVTVLQTFADTDSTRLGMTGYSAGSVATLNVNGFDDRLRAVVPVSGVGGFGSATAAGGWQNALLEAAELDAASPEFGVLLDTVDPINQAPRQHGAVLLVNGTQDEFFPLDSTLATFDTFPGDGHRLALIPNWDHGIYAIDLAGFGICGAFDNSDLAARRVEAATAFWFGHHLTGDARFAELPGLPTAELFEVVGFLGAAGSLVTGYTVAEVYAYASVDQAHTFAGIRLENREGNRWSDIDSLVLYETVNPTTAAFFTEFRLRVDLLGLNDFWITSRPGLPPGFVPQIRPIDPFECL